jgi:HTH-type transcriptional regulator, sugar sensing transcriptional regulator
MKDNSVITVLESLGLQYREIQVFLILTELGPSLAATISKKTNINRSTVYLILDDLKTKSIISTFSSRGVTYFQAVSPEELLLIYERKVASLKEILPFLESVNQYSLLKPKIHLFEGREGLIRVMEDTLTSQDGSILVYADITAAVNSSIFDYYPTYIKRRIQKKLVVKGIFCDTPDSLDFKRKSKSELREVYLLPSDMFPFENEINIYNNKFSLISHKDNLGVIIENESISNTQKLIFNICWEFAKNFKRK